MNEHAERILDEVHGLAEQPVGTVVFVQDDSDYPVDPLDASAEPEAVQADPSHQG